MNLAQPIKTSGPKLWGYLPLMTPAVAVVAVGVVGY